MKYRKNDLGRDSLLPDLSRRRFVQGLTAGGAMAGLGMGPSGLFAKPADRTGPQMLRGTEFDLDIGPSPVNFTGSPAVATTINGSVPAPVLRWREGERVTLRVTNRLPETSSIHWHGIILPPEMDGVPGISFDGIAPGETFRYQFDVGQSGCPACGGAMRIIACIEDPDVIEKILTHLDAKAPEPEATRRPPCRAPPQRGLFDETG